MKHFVVKLATAGVLSAALYLAISCPCEIYLECHREKYLALLAVAAFPAIAEFKPTAPLL